MASSSDYVREPLPVWKAPPPTQQEVEWADILTIDLSLYETDRNALIETMKTALQRDGFFYVVNTGIDAETINRQFAIGELAFDGVSQEEKLKHEAPIKEKGSFIGYKLPQFWEIKDGVKDRIEHYNFYNNHIDPLERHPEPLRPFVPETKDFLHQTRNKILRRLITIMDNVLELPEGHLWSLHDDGKGGQGDDLLRYMMYNPLSSDERKKTSGVMLSGHTDFNTLSMLVSQPITALQVLMPDNKWRYVKHQDNAFVVNLGDQLSWKTGGILKGTMHRVISPPADQRQLRRLGVFHFAHFINGIPLDLLPSRRVHEEGKVIFSERIPTSDEWESTRIKSYGTTEFVKGDEYDIEIIAGIQVRHYHSGQTKYDSE